MTTRLGPMMPDSGLPDLSGGALADMPTQEYAQVEAPAPFLPSLSKPSERSGVGSYAEKRKLLKQDDLGSYENGPGATMFNYLTMRTFAPKQEQEQGAVAADVQPPVKTKYPEALKSAMALIGLHSSNNPTGLQLDHDDAREFWAGSKDKAEAMSQVDEASFRAAMEAGDGSIDAKRIRMFSNYDGSTTWEVLNNDKSVLNKFTLGVFNGKKVFVQGGYDAFARELNDIKSQSEAPSVNATFDKLRQRFNSGRL